MPNPYNNKIQLADGTVLLDLSSDTLSSADQLMQGVVAHDRTGAVITGTGSGGMAIISDTQDQAGGTIRSITTSEEVYLGTKTVTENGVYSAEDDSIDGYSSVTVNVPSTAPSGIKYVYSDIDGEGAWDVSGYQHCSYDFAPLWDSALRYWFDIDGSNLNLTVQFYLSRYNAGGGVYIIRGLIDWGDGIIEEPASNTSATHVYDKAGRYCVTIRATEEGSYCRTYDYVPGNNMSTDDTRLVAAEVFDKYSSKQLTSSAFRRAKSLKKVSISNDIRILGNYAFALSGIEKITIPESVTSIGSYCFQNSSLIELHMKPTTPPTLGVSALQGLSSSLVIYVPSVSLSAYQSATDWSTYASYMVGE